MQGPRALERIAAGPATNLLAVFGHPLLGVGERSLQRLDVAPFRLADDLLDRTGDGRLDGLGVRVFVGDDQSSAPQGNRFPRGLLDLAARPLVQRLAGQGP